MKTSLNDHDFVLGLEENAIDSLAHAVEHFLADERPTDLKYTVLHTFHATELFLKARLAASSPELIYRNKKVEPNGYTVGFDKDLKKRLRDIGVILSAQDENDLTFLQQVRNSIEHHQIAGNREEIEDYVGRAMYFLETFLQAQLRISLKDKLDKFDEEIYQTLSKAQLFYIKRMREHGISVPQHPNIKYATHDLLTCEECGEEEAIAFPDPTTKDGTVHCFLCHSRYSVEFCLNCPNIILSRIEPGETTVQDVDEDFGKDEGGRFCDYCLEQIAERDD